MRTALLVLIGLAGPTTATAEDFTGFYAGVNAGYAVETGGRDRSGGPGLAGDTSGALNDRGLPPSARDASRALQSRNRTVTGGGALTR